MFHCKVRYISPEESAENKLKAAVCLGRSVKLSGREAVSVLNAVDRSIAGSRWTKKPTTYKSKKGRKYVRNTYICPHCGKAEVFKSNYCRFCGQHMITE